MSQSLERYLSPKKIIVGSDGATGSERSVGGTSPAVSFMPPVRHSLSVSESDWKAGDSSSELRAPSLLQL